MGLLLLLLGVFLIQEAQSWGPVTHMFADQMARKYSSVPMSAVDYSSADLPDGYAG
jgi:hypothetical protein